jgi:hypothetical protein
VPKSNVGRCIGWVRGLADRGSARASLDNGILGLEFDDKTGSVRQITDRQTGKRWLDDPRGYRLANEIRQWNPPAVFRYLLPTMIPVWCIDENQRDVLAEAFAIGSFLAVATRDMTGRLSDAPALAAQIKRLAALRKATAPFVSHGQFVDNRGLDVEGGKGFVYRSDAGLAVALANGQERAKTLRVTLDLAAFPGFVPGSCTLFVEGQKPVPAMPRGRGLRRTFAVALPPFAAAVVTL